MNNKGITKIEKGSERSLRHYKDHMASLGNKAGIFMPSAVSCIHINC